MDACAETHAAGRAALRIGRTVSAVLRKASSITVWLLATQKFRPA